MKRYVGYVRVSTQEQARQGVSISAQRERIEAYCAYVGAELVTTLQDDASGKTMDRPGVAEAVRMVLDGEVDGLVVYAIDRLSRSTLDLLLTVDNLTRGGRDFVSVREQLDTSTPHGRFTLTILGALAQMERELIASRTREGMGRCRAEHRVYSPTPYGWDASDGRLLPNPGEQEVLAWMRVRRARGLSLGRLAAALNARGVPPKLGGRWGTSSVASVLSTSESFS